jgi:MFS transporter, DHA3 family, macrolide efflux protein
MKQIFQHRGLRLIFIANLISMIGSGMNSAAVNWYILQRTHSEMSLGMLVILMTIPAMCLLPFSGVVIDREDRRILVMSLDAVRALIILAVAILALRGKVQLWEVYGMVMLVAAGFYMFWPTITALIQELTPETQFVQSNAFLLAGVQGGWLIAGAIVGFVYNHIGLGGVLLLDFTSYVASFSCYLLVRKGRHTVQPAERDTLAIEIHEAESAVARFWSEMRQGFSYVIANRYLVMIGASWSMFLAGMMTQNVLTAPMSERLLHAGAVGYGWLNAGWGTGAFTSMAYTAWLIEKAGGRRAIALCMGVMGAMLFFMPLTAVLPLAVLMYLVAGSARGVGGVAINATVMQIVPRHFMGRTQNIFFFFGMLLQIVLSYLVGVVAHTVALKLGFWIVASVYTVACIASLWPMRIPIAQQATGTAAD